MNLENNVFFLHKSKASEFQNKCLIAIFLDIHTNVRFLKYLGENKFLSIFEEKETVIYLFETPEKGAKSGYVFRTKNAKTNKNYQYVLMKEEFLEEYKKFRENVYEYIMNHFFSSWGKYHGNLFETEFPEDCNDFKYKKYSAENDEYPSNYFVEFLNGSLVFSNPKTFNDPFDCDCELLDLDSKVNLLWNALNYLKYTGYGSLIISKESIRKALRIFKLELTSKNFNLFIDMLVLIDLLDKLKKDVNKFEKRMKTKDEQKINDQLKEIIDKTEAKINENFPVLEARTHLNKLQDKIFIVIKENENIFKKDIEKNIFEIIKKYNQIAESSINHWFIKYEMLEMQVKNLKEDFRVLCTGNKFDDILMWGYYCNGGEGVCCEYTRSNILKSIARERRNCICIYGDIEYSDIKPQYTFSERHAANNIIQFIIDCLFTKFTGWKHENEFRYVLLEKTFSNDFISVTSDVKNYYVGCKLDDKWTNSYLSTKGKKVIYLKKSRKEYKLIPK